MDDVPHLALPLQVVGDRFTTVQQDTEDELVAAVRAICAFQLGARIERPDFGIPAPELSDRPLATTAIEQAVSSWEPRALIRVTEAPYDPLDPLASRLRVEVRMHRAEEEEL